MGETGEGPSGAAQRAQQEAHGHKQGFFERLFNPNQPQNGNNRNSSPVIALATNGHAAPPAGGIGNLNRVRVQDVAVPRAEIVSVPSGIVLDELIGVFRESGLTRLPVFDETLDSPLGFIHLKDLALRHGFACDDSALDLATMLRPLLFAPPSMPIGVLLQKMQSDRIHMALVIDEYGGVDGLVTIEDLIEPVVGEIEDEHDVDEDVFWSVEEPGIYLCLAKTPLDEFEAETGLNLTNGTDEDEVGTLGGLVFVLTGRVPVRGEVIKHASGAEFEVLDADPRRLKRLRVVLPGEKGN